MIYFQLYFNLRTANSVHLRSLSSVPAVNLDVLIRETGGQNRERVEDTLYGSQMNKNIWSINYLYTYTFSCNGY